MRLLISIALVLAALGSTYWLLRGDPSGDATGTGPRASATPAAVERAPLDLARGESPTSDRATVAPTDRSVEDARLAKVAAESAAADAALAAPVVPEPSLEGGMTNDLVGSSSVTYVDKELAQKYAAFSHDERVHALDLVRRTLEQQRDDPDKDVQAGFAALKHELTWLEQNLDG